MEIFSEEKALHLRLGVTGLMRVKDDADFVGASIDSCIDAIDELVVVYNDCSDNSPEIIERKRREYPNKIKVFEYKPRVYALNLTKEEYEIARGFPEDSPHLLSSYYNFALSKASFSHALKIDADQVYFSEELKELCDIVRVGQPKKRIRYWIGAIFHYYFLLYRFISLRRYQYFPILPEWMVKVFRNAYIDYARYKVKIENACISLSGINVVEDEGKWYVPMGWKNDNFNILPPYNGENDHLIFRVSPHTYYKPLVLTYYNMQRNNPYSVIEEFVHPYKPMFMGFAWFHLNSMRRNLCDRVREIRHGNPARFMELPRFLHSSWRDIDRSTDREMTTLHQRVLFSFIHPAFISRISSHITLLDKFVPKLIKMG